MQLNHRSFPNLDQRKLEYFILGILAVMYAPVLWQWFDGWLNKSIGIEHEYFSHGLIGIPFAFYLTWQKRQEWQDLPNQSHPLGLALLALGGCFYLTNVNEFINLSFPLILMGICLWLKGISGLKLLAFPFILIILATPNSIPYLITPYTLWLQKIIAGLSGFLLMQLGFDVNVDGIYLAVDGRLVEVAPYCAGLKMLFTSVYVSLILLYWRDLISDRICTITLLISAVLISVIGNVFRNAILAFFHGTDQPEAFHWFHDSWGGDLYSAILLGVIFGWLLVIEKYKLNLTKTDTMASETSSNDDFTFKF